MDVLYIDLLKRVLTNTLFQEEPDINEEEHRFVAAFLKHYIRAPAITMLPMARLHNIEDCVTQVIKDRIPGDLIETGVWRGGATILMRALLKIFSDTNRKVWVADSFEGLPEPSADEFPIEAKSYGGPVMQAYDRFAAPIDLVKRNFEAFGLLDDQVQFLPGWFEDTLSTAPIDRLAVMRLDGDYYSSTMDALTALYDRLSIGGFVIIDDYGEDRWTYCRKAVDEFRESRGITDPLVQVDLRCSFWRRTS